MALEGMGCTRMHGLVDVGMIELAMRACACVVGTGAVGMTVVCFFCFTCCVGESFGAVEVPVIFSLLLDQ